MPGLGTVVNVAAIAAGGIAGLIFGRFINEKIEQSLMMVLGICTIYIAAQGVLKEMLCLSPDGSLQARGEYMLLFSMTTGTLIGDILDIDSRFEALGEYLKVKTGNSRDERFVNAFVTASLTVAIGAMAIVGAIQDGIFADHSTLFVKAALDAIIIMLMTSFMGKGCIFSALPVGVLQGMMTVFAVVISPILTEEALGNISLTGSVLVLLVGINIIRPGTVRVANMLPSLVMAVIWTALPWT